MAGVTVGIGTSTRPSGFRLAALCAFLLTQVSDGVLTYIGVSRYGMQLEANPLLAWMMATMGQGPGLLAAKTAASGCGIALHLSAVHHVLAALTVFYVVVAILPWLAVLLYVAAP